MSYERETLHRFAGAKNHVRIRERSERFSAGAGWNPAKAAFFGADFLAGVEAAAGGRFPR